MGKQLIETLIDVAVLDASHISSAIELDGYYGVYETITEYLDEYIDGFYKSSKDSLLHRYSKNTFSRWAFILNCNREYPRRVCVV